MRTLIGVVTGTKFDKKEEKVAWILPIVEAIGSKWEEIRDAEREFPARGYIFWHRAGVAEKGALFHVRAKENGGPRHSGDEYTVEDARPVFEVVDLRSIGTTEQVRNALNYGIHLPDASASRVLVWCKGNLVVGPVSLVAGANGVTTIEKKNRAKIPCFHLSEGDICHLSYEGNERYVVPTPKLGAPHSYVDWDDDRLVLKRAIEFAIETSNRGSIDFPKQIVEEAANHLSENGANLELRLDLYRLNRARSLATDLKQVESISAEIIEAFRSHPSVAKEFEQLKASERKQAKIDAKTAIAAEQASLAGLKIERGEAEETLQALKRRLSEAEASVHQKTADIEQQIRTRVAEVLSDAPRLLSNVALLKPFLGETRTREVVQVSTANPWKAVPNKIAFAKDLRAKAIPALKGWGAPTTAYQPVHAAIAAKLLPIVAGSRAIDTLLAYAHVVAGGRSLIIPVTSAVADMQDLFGRVSGRAFVPHSAGLIDIVRASRGSEGPFLVVLEGINRGATESYLLPLLSARRRRGASISLFHPSAVESADPYLSESRFEWPSNLLLAATVVEGPTTLPIAPDIWNSGVLIQTDLESATAPSPGFHQDPSEIDTSSELFSAEPSFENSELLREVLPSVLDTAAHFEGGLRLFTSEEKALQEGVAKCVAAPILASIDDEDERRGRMKEVEKLLGTSLEKAVLTARPRVS